MAKSTLCTLPASNEGEYGQLANTSGFSLHAGVFANADEPEKLERLCRYISRPLCQTQLFQENSCYCS